MCIFFCIFVCEAKNKKSHICTVQRYEEIWTYASNRPDKINNSGKMQVLARISGEYDPRG